MFEINETGSRIKEAREKKGMKQNALASLVNIAPQTLSAYEKGSKVPTLENLVRIADALGVSLDALVWPDRHVEAENRVTLGDVAQIINLLNLAGLVSFGEISHTVLEESQHDYPEEVEKQIPALGFTSFKLSDFVKHYMKMSNLLYDGTIDSALFNQWIDARILTLKKTELPVRNASIEDEPPFPF